MGLTKRTILCLLLLACFTRGGAQEKKEGPQQTPRPDLSGTWVPDAKKGAPKKAAGDSDVEKLVIVHNDPEIRIRSFSVEGGVETSEESVYYSDGRGEEHEHPVVEFYDSKAKAKAEAVKSKTVWRNGRLTTEWAYVVLSSGGVERLYLTRTLELSPDGQKLTYRLALDCVRCNPLFVPSDVRREWVYRRAG